jgi:hypothetical protein
MACARMRSSRPSSSRRKKASCGFSSTNIARASRPRCRPRCRYAATPVRLTAITTVEHRANSVRVRGLLDTGLYHHGYGYGGQGYGYGGQGYGYGGGVYNSGDTSFRCDVDYRGTVFNVRLDRIGRAH